MAADPNPPPPAALNEVLAREFGALRPSMLPEGFRPAASTDDAPARSRNLKELYRRAGALADDDGTHRPEATGLAALCLSGGGIRSATFNLGVLQRLARLGLLGRFDYLSSVSGGGYIASWLRAWMAREGAENVIRDLSRPPTDPLAPEPVPVDSLREYSNYLTPRLGLLSADTWTAGAIVVRNMLLNWLVVLPVLGVLTAIPQLLLALVVSQDFDADKGLLLLHAALGTALLAAGLTHWFRRFAKRPDLPEGVFVACCVAPICASASLLSSAVLGLDLPWTRADAQPVSHDVGSLIRLALVWGAGVDVPWSAGPPRPQAAADGRLVRFALLWCVGIPVLGWLVSEARLRLAPAAVPDDGRGPAMAGRRALPTTEFLALVLSGAISAGLLVQIVTVWLPYLYQRPALYTVLAFPILLGLYLLARTLFVAFASLAEGRAGEIRRGSSDDADREWWARLSGWVLMAAVVWLVFSGLCLLGAHALRVFEREYLPHAVAALGGASGLIAAILGTRGEGARTAGARGIRGWALALAAPVFAVCAVLLVARGTVLLGERILDRRDVLRLPDGLLRPGAPLPLTEAVRLLWVPCGLALVGLLMGRVVNVNRFSLHGMYRNRLVRAYLGASNSRRRPDPFTGFALGDNLKLHELWGARATRPLPVINATLNLVRSGDKLAWQQRKAESFSMTPFFCGNFREGYRPSVEYGGAQGISLGTAVSVSGAAANPNMGYSSSAAIGFLLALFNARLGVWLGNTNAHGRDTYRLAGPRHALLPLLSELFGWTSAKRAYVNLSDGGHFDNLGLYEMVLRRCRYILVCDAGQDPRCAFGDLGNAIRKIRVDFGIPIEFKRRIEILPRDAKDTGLYCATAVIQYGEADGPGAAAGELVYIKPTLRGRGEPLPYDVYSNAESSAAFPHESTADQWFSESQFESYRALGYHAIGQICGGRPLRSLRQFLRRVDAYVTATTLVEPPEPGIEAAAAPWAALQDEPVAH